jgi:hypothetical protein
MPVPARQRNLPVFCYLLILLFAPACAGAAQSSTANPPGKNLFGWVENATHWDAVWHRGSVPCHAGDYDLAKQLQQTHAPYVIEWSRNGDNITAMVPELHRMFFVQTTPEGDLGRIQIEDTCATSLEQYREAMASRKPVAPVTDPAERNRLDRLQHEAARQGIPSASTAEAPIQRSTIAIRPQTATPLTDRRSWSKEKQAALESIVAAAMSDFRKFTKPGTHGQVIVPDFQLNDPEIILIVLAPNGDCVLSVGFERRASSRDPYAAYPTANCLADPDAVAYYDKLVESRKVETRDLLGQ